MFEELVAANEHFLPRDLVNEILKNSEKIRSNLEEIYLSLIQTKTEIRDKLNAAGKIREFKGSVLKPQHICGIDGSYVIDSLLSIDVICVAAVGVEGQPLSGHTPLLWKEPQHSTEVFCVPHDERTSILARALMTMKEINMTQKAPHDLILVDGSGSTPLAAVASGINEIERWKHHEVFTLLLEEYFYFRSNYKKALNNTDQSKIIAFLPKYVTTKAIQQSLEVDIDIDDRTLSTLILEEGEFIIIDTSKTAGGHQIVLPDGKTDYFNEDLAQIVSIYFRPRNELPALKIDTSKKVVNDEAKLYFLLEGISSQCISPCIFEPYPLFVADQFVKNIKDALIISRESASIQNKYSKVLKGVQSFINFYSFRTKSGGE